jgi:hypothetical protein
MGERQDEESTGDGGLEMVRRVAMVAVLLLAWSAFSPAASGALPAPLRPDDHLSVYRGVVDAAGLEAVFALGVDRREVVVTSAGDGSGDFSIEVVLSASQANSLASVGATLAAAGSEPTARSTPSIEAVGGVFRPYSGAGGIKEEMAAQAAAFPSIAQLRVIGHSVNGQDIVAVRVTKDPTRVKDGKRPTTIYVGAQHAREWITPEMVRRLLHHVLTNYGTDREIRSLVGTTEMWFVPVANPDGYDFTYADDGDRLWRKNLRDNDGNGVITPGDGVDPNRNYPTRWGYDNEGSSPTPASETYRGPAPASEPETQAMIDLFARTTPEFFINYHSAAELLLYGVGWQVATPSPDDVIYEAMAGDDAHPAVPGYDPDIGAELYVTNGEFDSHMQEAFGALGFTPEMSTCQTASALKPDDEWDPDDCESVFHFPDDEALIQAEFEKNIPFALSVAKSAVDPDDPVSVLGIDTPDFRIDSFAVSYGDPQTVAVVAKRALSDLKLNYRINGGRTRTAPVHEWRGGERYGFENTDYYAEYRGDARGARPGDQVEVWFTAKPSEPDKRNTRIESEHFTYTLHSDTGRDVLVIANEDYTGVNPDPPGTGPAEYLDEHVDALVANGIAPDVWDVDAQGVPHDLGVLSHYRMVVWYLGENRLTQDPEDEEIDFFGDAVPDAAVAERQQYLTIAVRDFLNGGGKLLHDGETTAYYGVFGSPLGGIYYGLDGAPEEECVVEADPFSDCLLLADDFSQYYLGAYGRTPLSAAGVVATAGPIAGQVSLFGGPAVTDNPVDEAGAFRVTSDVLPPEQFPQFASEGVADYVEPEGPFIAVEGRYAMLAPHADDSYMRLARTFDLSGVSAAQAPTFEAQFSYSTEEGYDHLIVEAHTVGAEDWTTLADGNGGTTSDVPTECEAGFLVGEHPNLLHYLTPGTPCLPTGTSGEWNSFTGESGGWVPVSFDLSAFAGKHVELVISYVTDPFSGGAGVLVDDTRLTVAGVPSQTEGFETGLGAWTVPGAPMGSPGNATDFERSTGIGGITAAVATPDTVLLGFGLEQLESPADRATVVRAVIDHLLGGRPGRGRP